MCIPLCGPTANSISFNSVSVSGTVELTSLRAFALIPKLPEIRVLHNLQPILSPLTTLALADALKESLERIGWESNCFCNLQHCQSCTTPLFPLQRGIYQRRELRADIAHPINVFGICLPEARNQLLIRPLVRSAQLPISRLVVSGRRKFGSKVDLLSPIGRMLRTADMSVPPRPYVAPNPPEDVHLIAKTGVSQEAWSCHQVSRRTQELGLLSNS